MTSHLTSCRAIISTTPFSTLSFSIHTVSACTFTSLCYELKRTSNLSRGPCILKECQQATGKKENGLNSKTLDKYHVAGFFLQLKTTQGI